MAGIVYVLTNESMPDLIKVGLTTAALSALHLLGYTTPAASGPGYWMFDGELLDERHRRMEAA